MTAVCRTAFDACVSLAGSRDLSALRAGLCRTMGVLFEARSAVLLGLNDTGDVWSRLWGTGEAPQACDISLSVVDMERQAHPLHPVVTGRTPVVVEGTPEAPCLDAVRVLCRSAAGDGPLIVISGTPAFRSSPTLLFLLTAAATAPTAEDQIDIALRFAAFGAEASETLARLEQARGDSLMLSRSVSTSDRMRRRVEAVLPQALSGNLVGSSAAMRTLREAIAKYGPTDVPVLLLGETGTGKDLVARELHRLSDRCDRPFVALNMGALPETLAEAELFGHASGAFTGAASDRCGHFLSADGGTLFLDEIGDMPLALQVKLLRVLQEKSFRPLGSDREVTSDFRLIAATHRDVRAMVGAGTFRQDLYYRLATGRIVLPPVRDRADDAVELVQHFLDRQARREDVRPRPLTEAARAILRAGTWPGNVRELEAVSTGLWLESVGDSCVDARHFVGTEAGEGPTGAANPAQAPGLGGVFETSPLREACESFEKELIFARLRTVGGDRKRAAETLRVARSTLNDKLKKYGLEGYGNGADQSSGTHPRTGL